MTMFTYAPRYESMFKNCFAYFLIKPYVEGTKQKRLTEMFLFSTQNLCLFCFVCLFDSLRPINNLSVIKGQVFLG